MTKMKQWLPFIGVALCSALLTALMMFQVMKTDPPPVVNDARSGINVTLIEKEENEEWVVFQTKDRAETWRTKVTAVEYQLLTAETVYGYVGVISYDGGETWELKFIFPYPQ